MITTNGQLYQWDVGRIIEVSHLATSTVSEIHVYNGTTDDAPVLILKEIDGKTVAEIPDELLWYDYNLDIYAVVIDNMGRYTTEHLNTKVLSRPKPADYVYTKKETKTYEALEKKIKELEEREVKITVDKELSKESENPVQNKIVTEALEKVKESVPTKTSQLENDEGFLTKHQDLSRYALKESIPTKTSQLENDSDFISQEDLVEIQEDVLNVKSDLDELEEITDGLFDKEEEHTENVLLDYSGEGYWTIGSNNTAIVTDKGYVHAYEFRIDDLDAEYILTIRNAYGYVDYYITDANKNIIITGERGTDAVYKDYVITDIPKNARYILITSKGSNTSSVIKKTVRKKLKDIPFIDEEDNEEVSDPYDGDTIVDSELSLESTNPIQNKAVAREFNKLGGTIEITPDEPEKENTVMTFNPNAESVNLYTAEEVDTKLAQLTREFNERLNSIQDGDEVMY